MEKTCVIFVIENLYLVNFLDLVFKFVKLFGLWLVGVGLGLTFRNSGLDLDRKI